MQYLRLNITWNISARSFSVSLLQLSECCTGSNGPRIGPRTVVWGLCNRKSIISEKRYFLLELLCMIHMNIKWTGTLTPDGGLINALGPLSQGNYIWVGYIWVYLTLVFLISARYRHNSQVLYYLECNPSIWFCLPAWRNNQISSSIPDHDS